MRYLFILFLIMFFACTTGIQEKPLASFVESYNSLLRWKKYDKASLFVFAENRSKFLEAYFLAEDSLHIENIEIRSIRMLKDDKIEKAEVVVVIHANVLPSVTLKKHVIIQYWEKHDTHWVLVKNSKEFLPEMDKKL